MHNNSLCAYEMKIEFSLHISVEDLIKNTLTCETQENLFHSRKVCWQLMLHVVSYVLSVVKRIKMSSNKSTGKHSFLKRHCSTNLLWKDLIGLEERLCIPVLRRPTNRVIIQRYNTLKSTVPMSTPVRSIASQIYVEVHSVWSKANIPTKS